MKNEMHSRKSFTFKVLSTIVKKGIVARKDMYKLLDKKFDNDTTSQKSARLRCLLNLIKIGYIFKLKRGLYRSTPEGMKVYMTIKNNLS